MMPPLLSVHELSKTYRVPVREAGLKAALRALTRPIFNDVPAVRQISFDVEAGEIVGLLGPNGAGKTTTLKMLSGLLYPTSGAAHVMGFIPWERRPDFLRQIAMVLGNKSQMLWDIPPLETFHVLGRIYNIPDDTLQLTLSELIELLDMQALLTKPVRNLSLGERMKCELVAGMLHRPRLLFLDEPTLGLDITMQTRLRSFIAEYNQRHQATIILTSHYMADILALCRRVILIHNGGILYDGNLTELARRLAPFKLLRFSLSTVLPRGSLLDDLSGWSSGKAELLECQNGQVTVRVASQAAPQIIARLLEGLPVNDMTVEDPPIEVVIDRIYKEGNV